MWTATTLSEIRGRGSWLALSLERETLDFRVVSLSLMLRVEMTLKNL